MRHGLKRLGVTLTSLGLLAACSGGGNAPDAALACHVGLYQTETGAVIDIGALSGSALRWRTMDGRTGRLSQQDDQTWSGERGWTGERHSARLDLASCEADAIDVRGVAGVEGQAQRVVFDVRDTEFESGGETLAGRLVLPRGEGPFPLAVLVHGSEASSALDFYYHQRLLPAQGVGVFLYDKRGTGASTGSYTQDFDLLAGDAVAALAEARRLGGDRLARVGYFGGSQGGWVAPYAASMSDADFVIAAFGMAEGPLAEDREEVALSLVQAGFGDDPVAMAGAREIADAAGLIMRTDFAEGVAELNALKQRYRNAPWYSAIEGEFTHEFLVRPIWQTRMGMPFFEKGASWDYEPLPVLQALDIPMLWVLADEDLEAPPDATRQIILDLQGAGHSVDLAVFPETDHGIVEFEVSESGERVSTRYADGYFRLLADWARDQAMAAAYGRAELYPERDVDEAP